VKTGDVERVEADFRFPTLLNQLQKMKSRLNGR